jgi:hypothetical protein
MGAGAAFGGGWSIGQSSGTPSPRHSGVPAFGKKLLNHNVGWRDTATAGGNRARALCRGRLRTDAALTGADSRGRMGNPTIIRRDSPGILRIC